MRWILLALSVILSTSIFAQQTFTYSYVDPCSKQLKTLLVPANSSVTVNYMGNIGSFSQSDFQSGVFGQWVSTIQASVGSQPCDELLTQTQVGQNMIITQNIISTLTAVTASAAMTSASSMSSALGNSVSNSNEGSGSNRGGRKGRNSNNGSNQSGSNQQTNNTGSESQPTNPGGTNSSGSSQSNPNSSSGSTSQSGSGQSGSNGGQTGQQGNTGNPNTANGSGQQGSGTQGQNGQASSGGSNPSGGQQGSGTQGQNGQASSGGSNGQGTSGTQDQGSSGTSTNTQGSTGTGTNGESSGQSQTGNNNAGASPNSGSQGQGPGQGGQSGQTQGQNPQAGSNDQGGGSGSGGTANSVSNAAEASGGSGGKGGSKVKTGSLIGTGDIVAIRSAEDNSNQFKGTVSMTKSNTNNTRAKGFLLNFTTQVNNSNLTFYGSFTDKKKKNTLIIANSSMLDLRKNFFNTTTALEAKRFGQFTGMLGVNFTVGGLADEPFSNLSAVGGGFVPFKAGKKINGTILVLGVYSPYTKFYEGKWWDSGLLLVPFSSWDYSISKNFKYNISFSGTYQLQGNVLQYQILTGGKILL
jgi:hypothetical protein